MSQERNAFSEYMNEPVTITVTRKDMESIVRAAIKETESWPLGTNGRTEWTATLGELRAQVENCFPGNDSWD